MAYINSKIVRVPDTASFFDAPLAANTLVIDEATDTLYMLLDAASQLNAAGPDSIDQMIGEAHPLDPTQRAKELKGSEIELRRGYAAANQTLLDTGGLSLVKGVTVYVNGMLLEEDRYDVDTSVVGSNTVTLKGAIGIGDSWAVGTIV